MLLLGAALWCAASAWELLRDEVQTEEPPAEPEEVLEEPETLAEAQQPHI